MSNNSTKVHSVRHKHEDLVASKKMFNGMEAFSDLCKSSLKIQLNSSYFINNKYVLEKELLIDSYELNIKRIQKRKEELKKEYFEELDNLSKREKLFEEKMNLEKEDLSKLYRFIEKINEKDNKEKIILDIVYAYSVNTLNNNLTDYLTDIENNFDDSIDFKYFFLNYFRDKMNKSISNVIIDENVINEILKILEI